MSVLLLQFDDIRVRVDPLRTAAFASLAYEPQLIGDCPVRSAVELMANSGGDERGAIFTRREVVDFILNLSGYTSDRPLSKLRLLEPSFGAGDFLFAAVERLLAEYKTSGGQNPVVDLVNCIRAVELHRPSYIKTAATLAAVLEDYGLSVEDADELTDSWLVHGDFLLTDFSFSFDFVVGNPPYIRQELIPLDLINEYKKRYTTIFDRADIYIPFIERSLSLVGDAGVLAFICADRWMKNRYGRPLRELVTSKFNLRVFIDMVDTPAFTTDVIAYPGIFVIANETNSPTKVARRPAISASSLKALSDAICGEDSGNLIEEFVVAVGGEPWIVEASSTLALVRLLEDRFPSLEEAGCKVGIGVATGADRAFIGKFSDLDVEEDRKLPLVMTRDILSGRVSWQGLGVINPFSEGGGLVSLDDFPRLKAYLEVRRSQISNRHVAKKTPANWYRTIDKIHADLKGKPKLLIPDIKGEAHIVYDEGKFYPHHNLYYITSEEWDLHALQAVLLSGLAHLFVSTYSTKMRGGYLRFQAQYLRRIRIPFWRNVPESTRAVLIAAGKSGDRLSCDDAVKVLYRFSDVDWATAKFRT